MSKSGVFLRGFSWVIASFIFLIGGCGAVMGDVYAITPTPTPIVTAQSFESSMLAISLVMEVPSLSSMLALPCVGPVSKDSALTQPDEVPPTQLGSDSEPPDTHCGQDCQYWNTLVAFSIPHYAGAGLEKSLVEDYTEEVCLTYEVSSGAGTVNCASFNLCDGSYHCNWVFVVVDTSGLPKEAYPYWENLEELGFFQDPAYLLEGGSRQGFALQGPWPESPEGSEELSLEEAYRCLVAPMLEISGAKLGDPKAFGASIVKIIPISSYAGEVINNFEDDKEIGSGFAAIVLGLVGTYENCPSFEG